MFQRIVSTSVLVLTENFPEVKPMISRLSGQKTELVDKSVLRKHQSGDPRDRNGKNLLNFG